MTPADRVERYARNVVSGKIDACKWIKAQCRRHLDDLKGKTPYDWSPAAASRICNFIELLPHIKGRWESPTIQLEDWQCFALGVPFGWKRKDGTRRYRTVYIEVPRKNAKSTLTAGVGLYMLGLDNEPGAECYSAATTRDQAKIVWGVAHSMVKKSPELQEAGYEFHAHSINFNDGFFHALSADADSLEGKNVHFAGIDELHVHPTRKVHDVLVEGTGSRKQPLIWEITTAGTDRAGVCYEQRGYCLKVLSGAVQDDSIFSLVYTLDDEDEYRFADGKTRLDEEGKKEKNPTYWSEEWAWEKANPNYRVSVFADQLAERSNKALQTPSEAANFKTKRLNLWVSADNPLFDVRIWDQCADRKLRLDDWIGADCYIGLDLASKIDLAAMVAVFHRDGEFAVFPWFWLPEDAIRDSRNSQYQGWYERGLIQGTEGSVIDFDEIESTLERESARLGAKFVAYDPWQATQLANNMNAKGVPMVELRQSTANLSEPTKQLQSLILKKAIRHDGNECMTWQISNVVGHFDAKDNVFPKKERPENKIDGPMAMLFALALAVRDINQAVDYSEAAFA